MSYLDKKHIDRIHNAYLNFKDEDGFTKVVTNDIITADKNARLNVQLYVDEIAIKTDSFSSLLDNWNENSKNLKDSMESLFKTI